MFYLNIYYVSTDKGQNITHYSLHSAEQCKLSRMKTGKCPELLKQNHSDVNYQNKRKQTNKAELINNNKNNGDKKRQIGQS